MSVAAACLLLLLRPRLFCPHACRTALPLLSPHLSCPPAPPAAKREGDQLFECFDAQDLNVRLKELMDGLSVKVSLFLILPIDAFETAVATGWACFLRAPP